MTGVFPRFAQNGVKKQANQPLAGALLRPQKIAGED